MRTIYFASSFTTMNNLLTKISPSKSPFFEGTQPSECFLRTKTSEQWVVILYTNKHTHNTMPQLDTTAYLSQITWLAITYGAFYLALTKYTLPIITKILYTRQYKALQAHNTQKSRLQLENLHKQQKTLQHVVHACAQAKNALQNTMNQSHTWVHNATHNVQHQQLQALHNTYTQHMQNASQTLAHTNTALKYTMNPAAQHACKVNKPNNINKTRVFQKAFLSTLFQHV